MGSDRAARLLSGQHNSPNGLVRGDADIYAETVRPVSDRRELVPRYCDSMKVESQVYDPHAACPATSMPDVCAARRRATAGQVRPAGGAVDDELSTVTTPPPTCRCTSISSTTRARKVTMVEAVPRNVVGNIQRRRRARPGFKTPGRYWLPPPGLFNAAAPTRFPPGAGWTVSLTGAAHVQASRRRERKFAASSLSKAPHLSRHQPRT